MKEKSVSVILLAGGKGKRMGVSFSSSLSYFLFGKCLFFLRKLFYLISIENEN